MLLLKTNSHIVGSQVLVEEGVSTLKPMCMSSLWVLSIFYTCIVSHLHFFTSFYLNTSSLFIGHEIVVFFHLLVECVQVISERIHFLSLSHSFRCFTNLKFPSTSPILSLFLDEFFPYLMI